MNKQQLQTEVKRNNIILKYYLTNGKPLQAVYIQKKIDWLNDLLKHYEFKQKILN